MHEILFKNFKEFTDFSLCERSTPTPKMLVPKMVTRGLKSDFLQFTTLYQNIHKIHIIWDSTIPCQAPRPTTDFPDLHIGKNSSSPRKWPHFHRPKIYIRVEAPRVSTPVRTQKHFDDPRFDPRKASSVDGEEGLHHEESSVLSLLTLVWSTMRWGKPFL